MSHCCFDQSMKTWSALSAQTVVMVLGLTQTLKWYQTTDNARLLYVYCTTYLIVLCLSALYSVRHQKWTIGFGRLQFHLRGLWFKLRIVFHSCFTCWLSAVSVESDSTMAFNLARCSFRFLLFFSLKVFGSVHSSSLAISFTISLIVKVLRSLIFYQFWDSNRGTLKAFTLVLGSSATVSMITHTQS